MQSQDVGLVSAQIILIHPGEPLLQDDSPAFVLGSLREDWFRRTAVYDGYTRIDKDDIPIGSFVRRGRESASEERRLRDQSGGAVWRSLRYERGFRAQSGMRGERPISLA